MTKNTPVPAGFYRSVIFPGMMFKSRAGSAISPDLTDKRTPEEHRAAVEAWRATVLKHDSQILGRKLKTEKPRHRGFSELSALLAMRNRPDGVLEGVATADPPAPVRTNWKLAPANDNQPPDEGFGTERAVEYVPSEQELKNSYAKVVVRYRSEPMMLAGGRHEAQRDSREIHAIPISRSMAPGSATPDLPTAGSTVDAAWLRSPARRTTSSLASPALPTRRSRCRQPSASSSTAWLAASSPAAS
jgi:hypothetical protein